MRGREKFARYKAVINALTSFWKVLPYDIRTKLFEHFNFRNCGGNFGFAVRYTLLKALARSVGDNVAVYPGSYILAFRNLSIGDNVSIQPMCYIDAFGGIEIGNSVSIGHGSTIMSTDHGMELCGIDMKEQPVQEGKVTIGRDTWVAAHCSILRGVQIPEGSVIAAGAVVNSKLLMTPRCIWGGGVPAKLIKPRGYTALAVTGDRKYSD